jgi:two-component system phosphate regulon response regulator PhoB
VFHREDSKCNERVTPRLGPRRAYSTTQMHEMGEQATSTSERVVVVEDEEDIRGLLAFTFRDFGWAAFTAATGREGLALVAEVEPAVVVLDLMLPDISGIEVCRRLRADPVHRRLGVMMLTARSDEYDRLLGFESGADDYVVKPFSVREVALRVRALARSTAPRGAAWSVQAPFKWRGLVLDPLRHRLRADGVDIVLRPLEYRVLLLLMASPGRPFTRAEVAAAIWDDAHVGSPRTIDTHVSRLRDALGPYASAVETVPGVGYRLGPEA